MIRVTFVAADGGTTSVEVEEGVTVKDAAVPNGVEGIVAECGGCCSCATCHVHVDAADLAKFPTREANEEAMLEFTARDATGTSRLGCQLFLEEGMGSVTVTLPDRQV
ncbi:2Fe-2S iron-sulfur cluster binding domain-containing protein [Rhodobacterales bacterium HKCCE2091]|nr:2Fe-2S iron-sulfur cluster binding domain-containing protein [Rhodobacterales bacterium HKCCE2091]